MQEHIDRKSTLRIRRPLAVRLALIAIGSVATALAVAGAILPGLPATPFLLVALWAFGHSSVALYNWLQRVPLLRSAVIEARRFEEKRALRPVVKLAAVTMAWGSVLLTAATAGEKPIWLAIVTIAAIAGTIFVCWVRTDRS